MGLGLGLGLVTQTPALAPALPLTPTGGRVPVAEDATSIVPPRLYRRVVPRHQVQQGLHLVSVGVGGRGGGRVEGGQG